MKSKIKTLILFAIAIAFAQCKKAPASASPHTPSQAYAFDCEDTIIDRKTPVYGNYMISGTLHGIESVYNVTYDCNDPDVIYFITTEALFNQSALWKYNRVSKTKVLLDHNVYGRIKSHKNGWLAYIKQDFDVYKIKTNGDSLTRIWSPGNSNNCSWSDDGLFLYINVQYDGAKNFKIRASDGQRMDTLNCPDMVWQYKNYIYYDTLNNGQVQIKRLDLKKKSAELLFSSTVASGIYPKYFFTDAGNTNLFWDGTEGFYRTELSSATVTKKIINAFPRSYNVCSGFDRSPINGNVICVQDSLIVSDQSATIIHRIAEFSADGRCYHKIIIY